MSNFPNNFDDDTTLPFVNDDITEMGGDAINALRDAVFAIEQNIGLGAQGTTTSIASRLSVAFFPNGTLKPSAITSLGLVTLPITEDQIAVNAQIPESKLRLDHRTQDLFNYIRDLSGDINLAIGWVSVTGTKLEPHLIGALYRHTMDQIDVSIDPINFPFMKNKFRGFRDNLQSYNLVNDINNELLAHQWADGSITSTILPVITNNGSIYPSNYGHTASGIFLNTARFTTIPQTAEDLQQFAEFVDESSLLLLGTRIQNLYSSGISKISRSSSLLADGYGQAIVPMTPAIAYLKGTGSNSSPFDDIDRGDDIIEFKPLVADLVSNSFDEKFSLVKVGDIVRINYGTVEIPFVIKEKKYIQSGGIKKFLVRIAGKNFAYSSIAIARIDRPLANNNKFGVLAVAPANINFLATPSLIVGSPRGAQALGVGFSPDQLDENHYLLYLALYPTGDPKDGYTILPGIDVTGNSGTTPSLYTLDSVVEATNLAFRQPGFNYRFIAFSYQGEFGIMLADSYNNAAFSILSVVISSDGSIDELGTEVAFSRNVVDLLPAAGHTIAPDPLGFGPFGANIASPPFMLTYGSPEAAISPTRLFVPLKRNNYYVDGAEKERLNLQEGQALDGYGDGYWVGTIHDFNPNPLPAGRVEVTYRIAQDLSQSDLKIGKTIVVQSLGAGGLVDFGRFTINQISFGCSPSLFTDITVYDAVHARGASPVPTLAIGNNVAIYFNSDSVSFNAESATDFTTVNPFKRHFEVYIDKNSDTFTHERGRISANGNTLTIDSTILLRATSETSKLDLIKISPKLRGYQFGAVNKITLFVDSFDTTTGLYEGFLCSYDGVIATHLGPLLTGKKGEVTRFYDETNIDFVDVLFDVNTSVSTFANQYLDIQLFPTLSLDDEIMLIGTCQLNDSTHAVTRVRDERQFGNTSEKELSTSALNFISLPEKLLHLNGVIRGFDISNINEGFITFTGGTALVGGKFQNVNNQIITIPRVQEFFFASNYPINWLLCVNATGELVTIALTDYDPLLGTPNSPNRLVTLKNIVSFTTYNVDSTNFVDVINGRKDLTPLYIVSATVVGSGTSSTITLTTKDIRRFVNDQDVNIPVVVTDAKSQGNFKNFDSAARWIKLDNKYQNTIQIKGSHSTSFDPEFISGNSINIVGAGVGASLTFNNFDTTMANVTFKDLTVTFAHTFNVNFTNVNFDNCVVLFDDASGLYNSTGGYINNSVVTIIALTTVNNLSITKSSVTFAGNLTATNSKFTNNNLVFTSGGSFTNVLINPSTVTFNAGTFTTSNFTMVDSAVTVNVPKLFTIGSGFRFERNTVTYAGTPSGGYTSSDLVNSSSGMIYSSVASGTLSNVIVKDNIFNTSMTDRFSFFSVELTAFTSILQDVDVSRNKFISTAVSEDFRAVISIISTLTTAVGTYPKFPRLTSVFIEGNVCNHSQLILISAKRTVGAALTNTLLTTVNTRISNNVCGTIGFITAALPVADFSNVGAPNNGSIGDKEDQIIINGNSCKFITNLDSKGAYLPFRSTAYPANNIDWVGAGTGAYTISNNSVNWIQVGSCGASTPSDGGMILNNRVSPSNPAYLSHYTDSATSGVTPGNVGILLRREFNATGSTRNIISGNIISQKIQNASNGLNTSYFYDAAIACFNNAHITGNSIYGVVSTVANPLSPFSTMLYLWSTGDVIVTGNHFHRNGLTIQAYVTGQAGASNQTRITGNVFDSQFIDAANTIETVGVNVPSAWAFHSNRNQVFYKEISLVDNSFGISGLFGAGVLNTSYPAHTQLDMVKDLASGADFFVSAFRQIGPAFYTEIASDHIVTVQDFGTAAGHDVGWTKRGAVDSYLAQNVKILNARVGYFETTWNSVNALDYTASPAYNVATLTLFKYKDITTSNDPVNGVLNVRDQVTSHGGSFGDDVSVSDKVSTNHFIASSGDETNIRTNTVIITVDLTAHDFTTDQNYRIGYSLDQNFRRATPTDSNYVFFDWSPIVLKCIYR